MSDWKWDYDWNDVEVEILERWIASGMSKSDAEATLHGDLLDAAEEDGLDMTEPKPMSADEDRLLITRSLAERTEAMFRSVDPDGQLAAEWLDAITSPGGEQKAPAAPAGEPSPVEQMDIPAMLRGEPADTLWSDWHEAMAEIANKAREIARLRGELAEARKNLESAHERESEVVSRFIDTTAGVPFMRCSPMLPDYIKALEDAADVKQDDDGITMGSVRLLREDLEAAEREARSGKGGEDE